MKILIVSDTHGQHRMLEQIVGQVKPIDMMIHLGDVEGGESCIRQLAGAELHMIAGNNDFFTELNREEEFEIGKYKVFITHGHRYNVIFGADKIRQEALERSVDIVMFGHTHKPFLKQEEGLTVLNPGSVAFPRQENRKSSYILMEIDRNGQAHYTINYL